MTTEEAVIYLASCAVNEEIPDKERISGIDPQEVLTFAKRHKISCCVAMALESVGIKTIETSKEIAHAMRRNAIFENSLEEVTAKLDEAGIWYVPLKGIILKKYYPKPFMREMADHDILVDAARTEDVKRIMEELGFTTKEFGKKNRDIYYREPILNYEMHNSLFTSQADPKRFEYYNNRKEFSRPEDFYLYTVTHEHKHFSFSGTGLRSLLDTYLYLKREDLNWRYVQSEAEKIGIGEFERDNRRLAVTLFGEGCVTDEQMLSYILSSNAYGTFSHQIENSIKKSGGNRIQYMLKRVSVPIWNSDQDFEAFATVYPLFYKKKILLPLLPLYRIIIAIKSGRFAAEWRAIRDSKGRKGDKSTK